MCEDDSSYLVFETFLWVFKSLSMIWNFKTHGEFYFVNFLCFYEKHFTHGFVLLFSILCFGFRFLLIYKWVILQITKNQFLNFVPLKKLVIFYIGVVTTPFWGSCEVATHIPKNGTWESSKTLKNSERDCRGQNTSHIDAFFIPLERSWSVDVLNGLAWAFGHL